MTTQRAHIQVGTSARSCTDHGPYVAKVWRLDPPVVNPRKELQPWLNDYTDNCPTCNATWQDEADQRDTDIKGGTSEKQRRAMARFESAGVPKRYSSCTVWNWKWTNDQQRKVWEWAKDYVSNLELVLETGRCGIFSGAPGAGKTHLAIGIVRHVVEKGGTAHYTTVMDMLGRIKDTYHKDARETEAQVIGLLSTVDFLAIDEVGKSLDTNYEQAQFFRLMDIRYRNLKPTLLATNLNKDKLVAYLGEAVVDRMREAGGVLLSFDWGTNRSTKRPPSKDGDS